MQTYSELHLAARKYAEAGIPVFPCEVNGKRPVTENGFYDATTDHAIIDAWWHEADYNIGFCPDDCGLLIADLDPGAAPAGDLPETYTVQTPRGGFHLYYEGSGPSSVQKIGSHVDTRGRGGYVLAPPSVVDGKQYITTKPLPYALVPQWIIDTLDRADEAAPALIDELDLPINVDRAKSLLERYVREGDVAVEGQGGDDHTYRLSAELLDIGLSPETALRLLCDIWNPHCIPPWSDEELATKLSNAAAYQQNEVGSKGLAPASEVFGDTIARLYPEKKSRFHFADEQEQDNEPDPKWIVKDLISERSTVLLYAPTSSYKSFIALGIGLSVATGKDAFGNVVARGEVFYAALEGRSHLKKARRAWKVAQGIVEKISGFYLGRAPMIGLPEEVQEFGDQIKKRCPNPRLIIIDTLSKSMAGLNENDALDAGKFIQFCDSLVENFGCSVIAIHHAGKDTSRGARGSSAFIAGFDTVIEVEANKQNKAVSVWVRKHKDAEEREKPWTFEGRVIGGSLAFYPTTEKEHFALTNAESAYAPRKIGAALQNLGAYGQDKAITTHVLATALTVQAENQSDEEHSAAVNRASRILNKGAKDFLEAYTIKSGKQTLWALPAPA